MARRNKLSAAIATEPVLVSGMAAAGALMLVTSIFAGTYYVAATAGIFIIAAAAIVFLPEVK